MPEKPFRIVNIAAANPDWRWISHLLVNHRSLEWKFLSTANRRMGSMPGPNWGRVEAALHGRKAVASGWANMMVSHGPHATFYVAAALASQRRAVPHIAMSFNFTDIPVGIKRKLMAKSFETVDRFAIFSRMEKKLYSEAFDIPPDKFDFLRWGVSSPITNPKENSNRKRYFVAMGGEARDYSILIETARLLPTVSFIFIVRPTSLEGMSVPDNVEVHVDLPWHDAWSYVWHAEAALLPLRSLSTPNGHVTIVGGMHLNKAHIATDSEGIRDYLNDDNAILISPNNPSLFAQSIERILDEPNLKFELGKSAGNFARENCNEDITVKYFNDIIEKYYITQ